MILRDVLCLSAATAFLACALPAAAQSVPEPRPRPASLTLSPIAPVAPAPQAEAAPPSVQAPLPASSVESVATTTPVEAPAAPLATAAPPPVDQAAVAPANPTASSGAPATEDMPPLDLTQPQGFETATPVPAPPGTNIAAADPVDTPAEQQTLTKVNSYFNGIRTLTGNFTQVGPDGSRADGKFFLMKPGKVRFYYQRPSTTDIIADGKSLVVRDRKLATQDVYPLSQTPLRFLLDTNLDLARDSKVIGVYEEPGLVSVAIEEETTFGGKARVLIVFASSDQVNYELKQWTITDAQGLDTTVALSQLDSATRPSAKLFEVDYSRDIKRN